MIAYLVGEITETYDEYIVLEVAGIGYEILMCVIDDIKLSGQNKIYIYEVIREDAHDLYGFVEFMDKQVFKKLITVNGIGPKAAAAMLSCYTASQIVNHIVSEDVSAITKISGIGTKIANRVILELKDKLDIFYGELPEVTEIAVDKTKEIILEATEALTALGYSGAEAKNAISAVASDSDTVEDLIKKALSILMT